MSTEHFFSLDAPLDLTPDPGQMRVAKLAGFPALARRRGADPRPLLERHDIDPTVIRDPDHFVDCKSIIALLEYCSSTFNDSLFGLQLAQLQQPDVYGCVTALCRAAGSVRESVRCFIDYIPVTHAPVSSLDLVEGQRTAELRWQVPAELGANKQSNYQATLLNLKLLHQIGGPDFQPDYVQLADDTRAVDIRALEATFGCRFHSTSGDNLIAFPVGVLDQPVPSASRLLFSLLGGYLEQLRASARTALSERVQDYIRGALPTATCSIERCARALGMSVRTLQARLDEQGLTFSELLEQQRMHLARTYLARAQLSLDQVACELGYAEASSFGRAFKRWTGLSPRAYRRAHAEPASPSH